MSVLQVEMVYKSAARVIGGELSEDIFPFIVSIQRFKKKQHLIGNWCNVCVGNILQPEWVITACHCLACDQEIPVKYKDPKQYRIVAGATDWEDLHAPGRQVVQAEKFIVHPLCKRNGSTKSYYDIGLIKLQSPLKFSTHVQPLKFFSKDSATAVGELRRLQETNSQCFTPGWGRTQQVPTIIRSSKLKIAVQTLHTAEECHKILCQNETIQEPRGKCADFNVIEQVCVTSKNALICKGDSGGPLVCNGFVFGVASQGSNPCVIGGYQIYAGIETIIKVIKEHITDWEHN